MMSLNYNQCLMEQGISGTVEEISDAIFKAKSHRMNNFIIEGDMYRPLDGLTKDEQVFCQIHKDQIDRNLNIVTQDQYLRELFNLTSKKAKKLLDQAIAKKNNRN